MKKEHRYFALYAYLKKCKKDVIELKLGEINKILGFSLPASAKITQWWSNSPENGHTQAAAWVYAGFSVSFIKGKVVFRKIGDTYR